MLFSLLSHNTSHHVFSNLSPTILYISKANTIIDSTIWFTNAYHFQIYSSPIHSLIPTYCHQPNMNRRRQHLHLLSPWPQPNTTPPSSTQFHRRIPSRFKILNPIISSKIPDPRSSRSPFVDCCRFSEKCDWHRNNEWIRRLCHIKSFTEPATMLQVRRRRLRHCKVSSNSFIHQLCLCFLIKLKRLTVSVQFRSLIVNFVIVLYYGCWC